MAWRTTQPPEAQLKASSTARMTRSPEFAMATRQRPYGMTRRRSRKDARGELFDGAGLWPRGDASPLAKPSASEPAPSTYSRSVSSLSGRHACPERVTWQRFAAARDRRGAARRRGRDRSRQRGGRDRGLLIATGVNTAVGSMRCANSQNRSPRLPRQLVSRRKPAESSSCGLGVVSNPIFVSAAAS